MKRHALYLAMILCFFISVIMKITVLVNLLAPPLTFLISTIVFRAFYLRNEKGRKRQLGLCFSLSILFYFISDLLIALDDMGHPLPVSLIDCVAFLHIITNVLIIITIIIYGLQMFCKWNIIQTILDSVVMVYLMIELIWIVFLNEDIRQIIALHENRIFFIAVLMDALIILFIIFWYISIRDGKKAKFVQIIAAGLILFAIVDLSRYYIYIYMDHKSSTLLRSLQVLSLVIIAIGAYVKMDKKEEEQRTELMNIGREGKGHILLILPILLLIFHGFDLNYILRFLSVILLYLAISAYVQNNIHKDSLLKRELELNGALEQKIKEHTAELTESNMILQQMTNQDDITGLFNRRYLLNYLEEAATNLKKEETIVLLYIDINRFKMISRMFGHSNGERILAELANKIKSMEKLVPGSIVASYGSDTYVFTTIGSYGYKHGREFAEEVIRLCSDIYYVDEFQIRITVNIGISILPTDAATKEQLIKHGDIAMMQARALGYNMIHEFDLQLSNEFFRNNTIELMLKKINYAQDFMVYYQPQLRTEDKKIIGFEALLRWQTAAGEFISPAEFIPIAEKTGYIIPIGDWVMRMVMKQLVAWNRNFKEKIMIGINVSLKQLNSEQFINSLKMEIEQLKVHPEWIDIEITESMDLHENPVVMSILNSLRCLGVKISIDDFGTGYSSLTYFKELPIDRIKLAKELIDGIHTDDFDYQLVKSIIQLSKTKGIKVIAEGVETIEQWETLKKLECDEVQGYYFGKPISAKEIENVFKDELLCNNYTDDEQYAKLLALE